MSFPIWKQNSLRIAIAPWNADKPLKQKYRTVNLFVTVIDPPESSFQFQIQSKITGLVYRTITKEDVKRCVMRHINTINSSGKNETIQTRQELADYIKTAADAIDKNIFSRLLGEGSESIIHYPRPLELIVWIFSRMFLLPRKNKFSPFELAIWGERAIMKSAIRSNETILSLAKDEVLPIYWDETIGKDMGMPYIEQGSLSEEDNDLPPYTPKSIVLSEDDDYLPSYTQGSINLSEDDDCLPPYTPKSIDISENDSHLPPYTLNSIHLGDDCSKSTLELQESSRSLPSGKYSRGNVLGDSLPLAWTEVMPKNEVEKRRASLTLSCTRKSFHEAVEEFKRAKSAHHIRKQDLDQTTAIFLSKREKTRQAKENEKEERRRALELHHFKQHLDIERKRLHVATAREEARTKLFIRAGDRQQWPKGVKSNFSLSPSATNDGDFLSISIAPMVKKASYDGHGRRRSLQDATAVATNSTIDSLVARVKICINNQAKKKKCGWIELIKPFDRNRNGLLNFAVVKEFFNTMRLSLLDSEIEAIANTLLPPQQHSFNYMSWLWTHHFNVLAFQKRWRLRKKNLPSGTADFYKKCQEYDSLNQGYITINDFARVLQDLKFHIGENELQLLCVQFQPSGQELSYEKINYKAFHDFAIGSTQGYKPKQPEDVQYDVNNRVDILQQLKALRHTQEQIHKLLKRVSI